MATIKAEPAGGKWSIGSTWEGGKSPGKGDDVILAKTSGNVTITATAECRSLEASEYEHELKLEASLKIGSTTSNGGLAVNIGANTKLVVAKSAIAEEFVLVASSAEVEKVTIIPALEMKLTIAGSSTYRFESNITTENTFRVHGEGTLETNGFTVKATAFSLEKATYKFGSSTLITTEEEGTVFSITTTATVESETSTIEIRGISEKEKLVKLEGFTWHNLTIAADNVKVTGKTTAKLSGNLALNTKGKSVKGTSFEKDATFILTIEGNITTNATATELIKWRGTSKWEISKSSGTVTVEGIELENSKATGGANFKDVNGVNVSGNEGWTFETGSRKETLEALLITKVVINRSIDYGLFGTLKMKTVGRSYVAHLLSTILQTSSLLVQKPIKTIYSTLQIVGHLSKEFGISKKFEVVLKSTGMLKRNITHSFLSILDMAGSLSRSSYHQFIGILGTVGNFGHNTTKGMTDVLQSSVILGRSIRRSITTTLGVESRLRQSIKYILPGLLNFSGKLPRTIIPRLSETLKMGRSLQRYVTHKLVVLLLLEGEVVQAGRRVFKASLEMTGKLPRNVFRKLQFALSVNGTLVPNKIIQLVVEVISSTLSFASHIPHNVIYFPKSLLTTTGSLKRASSIQLQSIVKFITSLNKNVLKGLSGILTFLGRVQRNTNHSLQGSLKSTGKLFESYFKEILKSSLSLSGAVKRTIIQRFISRLDLVGKLIFRTTIDSTLLDSIVLKSSTMPTLTLICEEGKSMRLIKDMAGFPEMEFISIVKKRQIFQGND